MVEETQFAVEGKTPCEPGMLVPSMYFYVYRNPMNKKIMRTSILPENGYGETEAKEILEAAKLSSPYCEYSLVPL